jgi:hypothetical protein
MKNLISYLLALFFTHSAIAQISPNQFYTPVNTGSNMTLGVNTDDLDDFIGGHLAAFNSEGTCIGLEIIQNQFFSMAIWGDDTGTEEIDGLQDGENATFAILSSNGRVITIAELVNFNGYITNALVVTNAIILSGCTNDEFLEFHTQGYTADVDNGSCSTTIYSLNLTPELFNPISQTDNNMNIGMNVSSINLFEGGTLGTFFDFDQDGTPECISTTEIQGTNNGSNGFFTIAIWGDDAITEPIDGLIEGQVPTFAILTNQNYVIAFEAVPDFEGYIANSFLTFTEINFDLTIYGCMDQAFCNFNPDAEEDDGSCEGTPGCTDDHYIEFSPDAACHLEELCETTWQEAYIQLDNELNAVNLECAANAQAAAEQLFNTEIYYQNQISTINDNFASTEVNYLAQIASLEDSIANYTSPISIDILSGWNIIGYTLNESQDAVATFAEIVNYIEIVKNNAAEVYWPEFSFNGIGDLIPGQGYQIKVTQAIEDFMYPNTNGQRVELSPTIPQWVIDMPTELHPNDIRSLIRTVNLLGQEVELNESHKGSTIIYLYSDGTVEKKIY